jgi:hypothetical protein
MGIFQRKGAVEFSEDIVHLGRDEHAGDLALSEQSPDHVHVFAFGLIGDIDAAPLGQHRHNVQNRGDKAEAGDTERAGALRHPDDIAVRLPEAAQHRLAMNYTFGLSRGTRSIQDISLRVRIGVIQRPVALRVFAVHRLDFFDQKRRNARGPLRERRDRHAQGAADILQDGPHSFHGIFRVNRHDGAPGAQHSKLGDNKGLRPGQEQGDASPLLPSAQALKDLLRHVRGEIVHSVIGDCALAVQHGCALRVQVRLLQKLFDYACHHGFSFSLVHIPPAPDGASRSFCSSILSHHKKHAATAIAASSSASGRESHSPSTPMSSGKSQTAASGPTKPFTAATIREAPPSFSPVK